MDDLLFCAYLCKLCYHEKVDDSFIADCKEIGINVFDVVFLDNENAEGLVYTVGMEKLFICWRGTDETKDMISNLKLSLKPFYCGVKYCGKVHSGFMNYYQKLTPLLNEHIDKFINNGGNTIVFTGHSLGASVLFTALQCSLHHKNMDIKCFTFGSPKLGDATFVKTFNENVKNSMRVCMQKDIVPKLPTQLCYKHVDKLLELKLVDSKKTNVFQNIITASQVILCGKNPINHSLFTYIDSLKKYDRNVVMPRMSVWKAILSCNIWSPILQ
jgi:Lipase (class 3)